MESCRMPGKRRPTTMNATPASRWAVITLTALAVWAASATGASAQRTEKPEEPTKKALEAKPVPVGQQPNQRPLDEQTGNLRAVVLVSWDLIDRLADDQIDADVPFQSPIMGGWMNGRVKSRADITIRMQPRPDDAQFTIVAEGTAQGYYYAQRDRISINGPLAIPFRSTKVVTFNGRQFSAGPPTVEADVQVQFNQVNVACRSPFNRLATRIVSRAVANERPNIEASAAPLAQNYLKDFVDTHMQTLVAQLNEVSDLEESLLRVYPQLRDWEIRLASAPDHLEARYAPKGSPPVQLPDDPRRPHDAGLQIWVRTTAAEAKLLERIGGWGRSQQLLRDYIRDNVSIERVAADAKVIAIDNWVVIAMGRTQAPAETTTESKRATTETPAAE